MLIKTTAGGIYDGAGREVPIGTELEVADHDDTTPHPWAGRFETISGSRKGKTAVTNPAAGDAAPVGPFTVGEKSAGWYAIKDAAGNEVGKALRKDDAKAFDTMTDDDKTAFAAEHAKG